MEWKEAFGLFSCSAEGWERVRDSSSVTLSHNSGLVLLWCNYSCSGPICELRVKVKNIEIAITLSKKQRKQFIKLEQMVRCKEENQKLVKEKE